MHQPIPLPTLIFILVLSTIAVGCVIAIELEAWRREDRSKLLGTNLRANPLGNALPPASPTPFFVLLLCLFVILCALFGVLDSVSP